MAIHDIAVEVTCDKCGQGITVEPDFLYRYYSGKAGYYDTSNDALIGKIQDQGWQEKDGKHFCEDCKAD